MTFSTQENINNNYSFGIRFFVLFSRNDKPDLHKLIKKLILYPFGFLHIKILNNFFCNNAIRVNYRQKWIDHLKIINTLYFQYIFI